MKKPKLKASLQYHHQPWEPPPPPAPVAPPPRPPTWNDLPHDARKCAKRPGIPDNAPVTMSRCIICRQEMFTRDLKLEDICERCEYNLIDEKHRLRGQLERRAGGQFVNPFAESSDRGSYPSPFSGGNTRLL